MDAESTVIRAAVVLFMRVRCGTKMFTPPDDIRSFTEAYTSVEKCVNSVCDITGSGWIDYKMYTGDYAQAGKIDDSAAKYGLCLLGVNLEKTIEMDDAVINNGLAAIEAGIAILTCKSRLRPLCPLTTRFCTALATSELWYSLLTVSLARSKKHFSFVIFFLLLHNDRNTFAREQRARQACPGHIDCGLDNIFEPGYQSFIELNYSVAD